MSGLIPNCEWNDFVKIANEGRLGELKSCEVKFNSEFQFTAIIPHGDSVTKDYAKTQAEYLGVRANISSGRDPAELLMEIEKEKPDTSPYLERVKRMAKAREALKAKREAKAVAV